MIRAVVWKEFREQGLIGLTLVAVGSSVLALAAALTDPGSRHAPPSDVVRFLGPGLLATLLLSVTAGMVCGGALFAAEREAGTAGFLESFPISRWRLWKAKLTAGSALVLLQISAVLGVSFALGLLPSVGWAFAIAVYALLAFAWGLFGSTLAGTTLGSVGIAISAASVAAFIFLVPILIFFQNPGTNLPRAEGAVIFLTLMFLTPLWWSAVSFVRPDRERSEFDLAIAGREAGADGTAMGEASEPRPVHSWSALAQLRTSLKAIVWLTARQLRTPAVVLSGFALLFGLALLSHKIPALHILPVLALTAGVLSGVTIFLDEQSHGSSRFWGERRLPVIEVWVVKVPMHLAFAFWLMLLVALPSCLRSAYQVGSMNQGETALSTIFRTPLFDQRNLGSQAWKYLLTPLLYGFTFGHLCGLLFRKAVVAAGVAGMLGGTAAALWVPSLLAGGVSYWQIVAPSLFVLASSIAILRSWSTDRLATRGAIGAVTAGLMMATATLGAGIVYRMYEVPDGAGGEDDIRYVAALVPFDTNEAGRQFRTAAERFAQMVQGGSAERPPPGLENRQLRMEDRVEHAVDKGFPADDPDLTAWLDRLYQGTSPMGNADETPWHVLAEQASGRPAGYFEHPQISATVYSHVVLENARRMGAALLARGLQEQAEGNHAAFPERLRVVLALSRNMRNGSIIVSLMRGDELGRLAFAGTDRWLQCDPPPAALRRVLAVLLEDERAMPTRILADGRVAWATIPADYEEFPFDPTPHLLAERYVLRELQKSPNQWLPGQLSVTAENREVADSESDLVEFAWSVPWERERTRRLAGLGLEPGSRADYKRLARGRPGCSLLGNRARSPAELTEWDRQIRLLRRVAIVRVAVRLYHVEKGGPPRTLEDLVAVGYLSRIPPDPYGTGPLRYRLSSGERFQSAFMEESRDAGARRATAAAPPTSTISTESGQPLVWSVGANAKDDGGIDLLQISGAPLRGPDLVFLIPVGQALP